MTAADRTAEFVELLKQLDDDELKAAGEYVDQLLEEMRANPCPSWCEERHNALTRTCWGPGGYLRIGETTLDAAPVREPGGAAQIVVHIEGNGDAEVRLTPEQARQHAAHVIAAAEMVEKG